MKIPRLSHRRNWKNVLSALLVSGARLHAQDEHPARVKIQVDQRSVLSRIADDFIGFGYETSAVAQTNYFSAKNTTLIRLYQNLGPEGLIRIGGNISDHARYQPDAEPEVHSETNVTILNRRNLENLAGFARATGWRIMWGLNLGTGSKEEAVQEAQAVSEILGDRLQSFQIGNEVDIHGRYTLKYHDFASYYSNYLAYKASIRVALPLAIFSGPDVAGNLPWLAAFATNEDKGVSLLTHHYYRTGAKTPGATIENLLRSDEAWKGKLLQLEAISRETSVPFRINEVNSFYGGGKAGVSDTFASALWVLDYMYQVATFGGAGVNMETDINQLSWISHYSPIVHDENGNCHARQEYYGMLAFSLAGRGELLKVALDKGAAINLSAYATRDGHGTIRVTVINKDLSRDAQVTLALPTSHMIGVPLRLEAPSITSTNHVSLGGAEVSRDGVWHPQKVAGETGLGEFAVPHASALLVTAQSGP